MEVKIMLTHLNKIMTSEYLRIMIYECERKHVGLRRGGGPV